VPKKPENRVSGRLFHLHRNPKLGSKRFRMSADDFANSIVTRPETAVDQPNTVVDPRFEDLERRIERLEAEAVLRGETQAMLPQRVIHGT
jgi:hypothetical protein